jgi:hypothetical protein
VGDDSRMLAFEMACFRCHCFIQVVPSGYD